MNNRVFIDLDKNEELPELTAFQGMVDIKRNGKILVKNSVLENIDTLTEEELRFILTNFKGYISPVVTSQYIPDVSTMKTLMEVAPDFKVRFKTEKAGGTPIVPISSREFFEGERIFEDILEEINPEWSELQKYRHLYNRTGQMLSYDLNTLEYTKYSGTHEKYSRNIFIAMARNWGICASFAASYDYLCYRSGLESQVLSEEEHDYVMIETANSGDFLTDPTMDAVRLKFGMRTTNFGISKTQFIEKGHNLEETEASENEFEILDIELIRQLDIETGYLDTFDGEYTDEYIKGIGNDLEGNNNFEKIKDFLERLKEIKSIGRPSINDFETIIGFILANSKDQQFSSEVKVYSFISDCTPELPRKIAFEVKDSKQSEEVQYYVLEDGLKHFEKVDKIENAESKEKGNVIE